MAKKLVDEYKDPGAGDEKKVRILREFVKRDEVYEDGEAENMRKEDKAGKRIIKDEQAEQNGDSTNEGTINKKQPKE